MRSGMRRGCAWMTAAPSSSREAIRGDADRGDFGRRQSRIGDRIPASGDDRIPDIFRVVFDPPRFRINLPELLLRHAFDGIGRIQYQRPGRCRALIDCEYMSSHRGPFQERSMTMP